MSAVAEIVPRRAGDLDGCVAALRESHGSDRYPMCWPDDPAAWLSPSRSQGAWVAWAGHDVVGHVVLTALDRDRAEISRLFVTPPAQRSGLAAALLDVATDHAADTGRRVELKVVEESGAAIRLYERLGWTLIGREPAAFTWPDGSRPTERRYAAPPGL